MEQNQGVTSETIPRSRRERDLVPAPHFVQIGDPIWIDAVCINLNDGHQIVFHSLLNPQIYTRANSVLAWVGVASGDTKISQSTIKSCLHSGDSSDLSKFAIPHIQHPDNEGILDLKHSVRNLVARSWFQKSDSMEEVALGGPITVYCGEYAIPLIDILNYVRKQVPADVEFFKQSKMLALRGDRVCKRRKDQYNESSKRIKRHG